MEEYAGNSTERELLSIKGDSATIDGKFTISNSIDIDCEIKGELDVKGEMTIQKNGSVNADVKTADAVIIGKYEGSLEASGTVEIKESGVVSGDIKTDSLIINKGGTFDGNVSRMTENK